MDTHFRERERCVPIWLTVDSATHSRLLAAVRALDGLLCQIDGDVNPIQKPDCLCLRCGEGLTSRPTQEGKF